MSGLQRDLFDSNVYFYDWHNDPWNLGSQRDHLAEGDNFEADGKTWFILGRSNGDMIIAMIATNEELDKDMNYE